MVLSRLGCSTVQLGIKVIDYFLGYRLPEYTFGKGALEKLPQILKEKDAGKVLVVTEAGLVELGFAKKLTDLLDEAGIEYAFYSGAEKNPTSNNVEDAFKIYRENGCRSVVALGGGSPMDCAKAVCARAVHPHLSVRHLQGILRVHKRIPLIVAFSPSLRCTSAWPSVNTRPSFAPSVPSAAFTTSSYVPFTASPFLSSSVIVNVNSISLSDAMFDSTSLLTSSPLVFRVFVN